MLKTYFLPEIVLSVHPIKLTSLKVELEQKAFSFSLNVFFLISIVTKPFLSLIFFYQPTIPWLLWTIVHPGLTTIFNPFTVKWNKGLNLVATMTSVTHASGSLRCLRLSCLNQLLTNLRSLVRIPTLGEFQGL